jgi:hypothetical protein
MEITRPVTIIDEPDPAIREMSASEITATQTQEDQSQTLVRMRQVSRELDRLSPLRGRPSIPAGCPTHDPLHKPEGTGTKNPVLAMMDSADRDPEAALRKMLKKAERHLKPIRPS